AQVPKLTVDQRSSIASTIASVLSKYFVERQKVSDAQWSTSYQNYLRSAQLADNRYSFDFASMEFIAELDNGHTFFQDSWLAQNYSQLLGFYARPIGSEWVVETSARAEVKSGDVVAAIDSVAMDQFFQRQKKYIWASSEAAQRHNLFLIPYLFPEQFILTLGDGRKVAINRASSKEPQAKVEGRWLQEGQTAYIHIPSFFYPFLEDEALTYLNQYRDARTIIIDVRKNPGGAPPVRLMTALMDRPYHGWKALRMTPPTPGLVQSPVDQQYRTGQSGPFSELAGAVTLSPKTVGGGLSLPGKPIFRGRLMLLVDGGCVSACEDFIEPFKDSGRATLVGETTQGSSGIPYSYDFHNGMILRVAVTKKYFADGSDFEGVGIKPDVEVHPTTDALKSGRDLVLEKAITLAEGDHPQKLHR